MKRLLVALVVLGALWLSDRAWADTVYYVNNLTGNDSNDGLNSFDDGTHGPWASIARACSDSATGMAVPSTANGDIKCVLAGGPYGSVSFNPAHAHPPRNGKRTTFIGYHYSSGQDLVTSVGAATFSDSFVSVRGLAMQSVSFDSVATLDSLAGCYVQPSGLDSLNASGWGGNFSMLGDSCVVDQCIIRCLGPNFFAVGRSNHAVLTTGARITRCLIRSGWRLCTGSGAIDFGGDNGGGAYSKVRRAVIDHNDFYIYMDNCTSDGGPAGWIMYTTANSTFSHNHIFIDNQAASASDAAEDRCLKIRDNSFDNIFRADTVIVTTCGLGCNGNVRWTMGADNAAEFAEADRIYGLTIDSCYVHTTHGIPANFISTPRRLTLSYSTFISRDDDALFVKENPDSLRYANSINHCTFVGKTGTANNGNAGIVNLGADNNVVYGSDASLSFNNSIIYSLDAAQVDTTCPGSSDNDYKHTSAIYWGKADASHWYPNSAGAYRKISGDNNLYYCMIRNKSATDSAGTRDIETASNCYRPGDANNGNAYYFNGAFPGMDSLSLHGSPVFSDSTNQPRLIGSVNNRHWVYPFTTWNYTGIVATSSAAFSHGSGGSDIGAWSFYGRGVPAFFPCPYAACGASVTFNAGASCACGSDSVLSVPTHSYLMTFTIRNSGDGPLRIQSISLPNSYCSVSPPTFTIQPGQTHDFGVTYSAPAVHPGDPPITPAAGSVIFNTDSQSIPFIYAHLDFGSVIINEP